MNTKNFLTFSILIFLLISTFVSCSPEDPYVVCKASEYDCDYRHHVPGILTVTKGSSRRHYILTEKGLEKANIKEGEPFFYNPKTGAALVKEITDSSIDILSIDIRSGKELSSAISLKPKMIDTFLSFPSVKSGCVTNDGTVVLLVNYEKPELSDMRPAAYSYDFLYLYEKSGKPKRFTFLNYDYEEEKGETEEKLAEKWGRYFIDEPLNIQCGDGTLYIFSERNYLSGEFWHHNPYSNWILEKTDISQLKNEASLAHLAIIAYDNLLFNFYSERENTVYSLIQHSEKYKNILRTLDLSDEYELPDKPFDMEEEGDFLLSTTPDGRTLVFFIGRRENIEQEQKIIPLFK